MLGSGSSWNPCLKPQDVMFIAGFIDKLNRLDSEWNVGDKRDIRMQMLCVALHMFSVSHSGFCCLFKARYDHGRFEVWIYPFLWGTFATGVCLLGRWIFLKFYTISKQHSLTRVPAFYTHTHTHTRQNSKSHISHILRVISVGICKTPCTFSPYVYIWCSAVLIYCCFLSTQLNKTPCTH